MTRTESRIHRRLFPQEKPYDTSKGGFAPLPLFLRALQHLFKPREWQIYTYVLMRAGPGGIAWFTLDELAYDLDFASKSKLRPHVDAVVDAGWLRRAPSKGKDYYMVIDPLGVIEEIAARRPMSQERREALEDTLEMLGLSKPQEAQVPS